MTDVTEAELEQQARDGDNRAFGELIRRWDPDLRGVAWSICRSAQDTDDIMQKAYEKAFRKIGSFDGRSRLKTWVWSICHHAALDHVRYERRRMHEPDVELITVPTASTTAGAATDRMELDAVLESLDPVVRSLLMLTAGHGLSVDEAAEITNLPRGTAASKISRARTRLQRWDAS